MRLAGVATLAVAGLLLSACSSDTESVTEATTAAESSTEEKCDGECGNRRVCLRKLDHDQPGHVDHWH